jgi:hypothetical protein
MRERFTHLKPITFALLLLTGGQLLAQPCATPGSVTATPSAICPGGSAVLNAVSTNNNIAWYTVPSGGVPFATVSSGANVTVTPGSTTTYYAEAIPASFSGSQAFSYTGGLQSLTVPTGITQITIDAYGAQGGLGGGLGARIMGTVSVTPGELIRVMVGGAGTDYSNGNGGGGGGSFVWRNAGPTLLIAAAGGGGTSNNSNGSLGGPGSATTTPTLSINGSGNAAGGFGGNGGTGGDAANGGAGFPAGGGGGAGWNSNGGLGLHTYGATGGTTPIGGGAGGVGHNPCGVVDIFGGYGGGGGGGGCSGASGGGGGYNGGGGGNCWNGSTWGSGGGGGSFNSGSSQANVSGIQTGNGSVFISWIGSNCTTSGRIPVTVTVNSNSTGPLGVSGLSPICSGTPVTLSAVGGALGTGASYTWFSGSCGSTVVGTGSSISVSPTSTTTYFVRAAGTCNTTPCASFNVAVAQVPTVAAAGPDQVLCASSTTLAGNVATAGLGAWSIISGAGGTITTPSSATSGFSGTPGVLYVLRWTISNPPCTATSDDVQIYFTPSTTTANAGPNQTICATSTFLAGNAATSGTGTWSIISGSGGVIATPSSESSQFSGNPNTTYTLRWTITNSPCPTSFDDVVITLTGAPTVAAAGADQIVCGSVTNLTGNPATSGTGTWTIVSGTGGSITAPGNATSAFSGTNGTTYTLRWTIANLPCTETADDVVISFTTPSTVANAGPNQMLCATSTTLAGNAPAVGSGSWSIVSGTGGSIANPSSPTSPFNLTAGVTYNLRWTITNPPCAASSDDVLIFTDNSAPTITCPANINSNGNVGQCFATVNYTAPVGTDNCSGPTTAQTAGLASGASFPAGTTTNTFTVTDAFGNTGSCSFTVSVTDNQIPTITCPPNVATTVAPGLCNATVTYVTPVGADNCAGATTTQTSGLNSGSTFPRGNVLNTFRVTDAAGNTATCTFTVTVNDNEAPVITCPASIVAPAALGTCNAVATYIAPNGTDNCTGATTIRVTGLNSGSSFPIGVTTNLFRVTDGSGNSTTCSFTVTVTDAEAPTVTCPANITVGNGPGMCGANVSFVTPVGTDNCSSTTTSLLAGLPTGGAFPVGTTTNTFAVTDVSSNSATCSFTVTVNDTEAPTAICQNITLQLDTTGNATVTANALDNNSIDNCTSLTGTAIPTSFSCGNLGDNPVVLTLTDQNGNSSTCAAIVTIVSSAVAVAITADSTSCGYNVSCFAGSDGVATANGLGGCPGYTYSWSNGQTGATATGLGAGTHTVTVTDANGNTTLSTILLTSPPPFTVSTTSSGSCEGFGSGTITTSAQGGNDCLSPTYQWSNGATTSTLTGLTPGIYNLTVTDAGGCTVSRSITVATLPTPLPTFTQSGNTLTSNQTWSSYQWLLGGNNIPGATNSSFTASQSGSYALSVTDTNGCTGTSNADSLTFVGMADPTAQWTGLSLYPNPTRDEFKLRTEMPIGHALTVTVRDLYGRELFSKTLTHLAQEEAFEIKSLAASTYMVEVTSQKGQRKVFRLVVE